MSKPYSQDSRIFTFGVHATINTPDHVREVVGKISTAVGKTNGPDVFNKWGNGFSWLAPRFPLVPRQNTDRAKAADRLGDHVLAQIDKALADGSLDRRKPLVVNLVGFSHGGNVAIQAADDIAKGLKERGIDGAIHLAALSTPDLQEQSSRNQEPRRPREHQAGRGSAGHQVRAPRPVDERRRRGRQPDQSDRRDDGIPWGNNNFPGANNKTFDAIPSREFQKGGAYDNLFDWQFPGVASGQGEAARTVSVNVKDTDGAAQKLLDAVVAKAMDPAQTRTPQTPAIEPEQRRRSAPSLG